MISRAGQWTRTLSTTCLQPRNEMLIFGLRSTSDDWPGWSMDSNPICYPSPAKKMKCLFLDYVQLLIIGQAGQWTRTPSATPLQPKKWNACFWIMFNFWRLARLVDGCESHLAALSSQKNEYLIFGLCSTSDDQLGCLMDSKPIHHPSPTKKWNTCFCITFNFWWSAGLVDGLELHPLPFSSQKNEMLIFVLHSTSDDWPGWSLDSNPIHLLSQAKKNEMLIFGLCLTSDDQPGWLMNLNPICHPSAAKKWNAHFWIMFNFWWLAGLVIGLEPHVPPMSSQKSEMLIFGLHSISGDQPCWSMDSNPIHHPSPAKEWNACFWITFNFWWLVRLVNGLEPHLPPLSNQKNDMLIFGLRSTSYNWPGWSMDSNPICNPSPTKKMKCSFLDNVQLLMIGQFNFWWSARLVKGLQPHLQPLSNQKNEMVIFVLSSNSGDQPSWLMDSNPICHPSPTKKMKCLFCIML